MVAPVVVVVGGIALRLAAKALAKAAAKKAAQKAAQKAASEAAKKAATQAIKKVGQQAKVKPKGCVKGCPKANPLSAAAKKKYARPKNYRKGVRDKVWNNAKGKDGKVRDPVTGKAMKKSDPWDMGHKKGYEFRKHQQSAADRKISRKEFLDEHNDPKHYRPETPSSNRSHRGESRTGAWKGKKGK